MCTVLSKHMYRHVRSTAILCSTICRNPICIVLQLKYDFSFLLRILRNAFLNTTLCVFLNVEQFCG